MRFGAHLVQRVTRFPVPPCSMRLADTVSRAEVCDAGEAGATLPGGLCPTGSMCSEGVQAGGLGRGQGQCFMRSRQG